MDCCAGLKAVASELGIPRDLALLQVSDALHGILATRCTLGHALGLKSGCTELEIQEVLSQWGIKSRYGNPLG